MIRKYTVIYGNCTASPSDILPVLDEKNINAHFVGVVERMIYGDTTHDARVRKIVRSQN